MSLINDALKRASQAQKKQGSQPAAGPEMQPAPTSEPARGSAVLVLSVCLVVIVGISAWLFFGNRSQPAVVATPVPAPRPVAPKPTNAPLAKSTAATNAPAVPVVPQAVAAPVVTQSVTRVVPPATNALPATPAPVPPKAAPVAAIAPTPAPVQPAPAPAAPPATPVASPAPAVLAPFPNLKLKGIIYSEASPQVLINESYLSLGDEIQGARVIKIERKRVTVKWNNQTRELVPE